MKTNTTKYLFKPILYVFFLFCSWKNASVSFGCQYSKILNVVGDWAVMYSVRNVFTTVLKRAAKRSNSIKRILQSNLGFGSSSVIVTWYLSHRLKFIAAALHKFQQDLFSFHLFHSGPRYLWIISREYKFRPILKPTEFNPFSAGWKSFHAFQRQNKFSIIQTILYTEWITNTETLLQTRQKF